MTTGGRAMVGVFVAACVPVFLLAQQPARDATTQTTIGTGVVAGTVMTDEANPQPLRRAYVALLGIDAGLIRLTMTDAAGKFAFAALAADRYLVGASKAPYVSAFAGAKRPGRPGTPISLAAAQQLKNLTIKLRRGGVITGTVTDDDGQPAAGVSVRVVSSQMRAGERTLTFFPFGPGTAETDDRGVYRIHGLPPGEYAVSATPTGTGGGELRQLSSSEVDAGLRELREPAPMPRPKPSVAGSAPGAVAVAPIPVVPIPGSAPTMASPSGLFPPTMGPRVGYVPVYYPGTTVAANAAAVTIAAGDEQSGVDMRLELVRTARVEGVVLGADGSLPANVQVALRPVGPVVVAMFSGGMQSARPALDGKFALTGVPPGQYTILARTTAVPGSQSPVFWATSDVIVSGQDLSGFVLQLQPGLTLSGKIVFENTTRQPPKDLSSARVIVTAPPSTGGSMATMTGVALVDTDATGRFTVSGLTPGKYILAGAIMGAADISESFAWSLKSAMIRGGDVADLPFEIAPGESLQDAVVTFTDRSEELSGTLQEASGRPAPDYTIVVFAVDKRYWIQGSRRIQTTRPGTDGRFKFGGQGLFTLPPGEYYMTAVTDLGPEEQYDAAFLDELVKASLRFTIREGERKVQDLRLVGR